ncbi:adenylyl-sulfate kinase [Fulvivirgaceae bacterium BMA10]|uniref:Adenylyl-sulfate kinase n=1 Tax=Splendidivirga corallicola TaxID=3051826 RepID=A0ABT8KV67_9BACT|nr:adenylyl-sulfate kinase [Fulvivirgaceae bacterium BMA10]
MENIHPIFDQILKREDKENLLRQKGVVIWMIGLSGSGKSTLAKSLERTLFDKGHLTQILDGDNLRTGLNNNLGFSEEDRTENIRRVAEVAKLFANCGVVTICSFISPTEEIRQMAKAIIGNDLYYEVFVNCSLEVCEERDVKGLYAKARKGEIKNFTGIDSPFENPKHPNLELKTDVDSLEDCLSQLKESITQRIKIN